MVETNRNFVIENARIVQARGVIENGWLRVDKGVIAEIGSGELPASIRSTSDTIDAMGDWLVPGFIDVHVHGADGAEVMDGTAEAIERIGRFHVQHGTTSWLPTTVVAPAASLKQALLAIDEVRRGPQSGPQILGAHLEGPMISRQKIGAQNPAYVMDASVDKMKDLVDTVQGLVRKVTIAPDLPGAIDVISWLTSAGIISSAGHTEATAEQMRVAHAAGLTHATHLFNAMLGLHHREAGTVGGCLGIDGIVCELIADGHHVTFDVIDLALRLKGPDGLMLITDAIAAAGRPDGRYQLGGLDVDVTDGICMLTGTKTLAGSTLTMDVAVRNIASRSGVTLVDAVTMASGTPARELGVSNHKGTLQQGHDADMVLLDESLSVVRTWVAGDEMFTRD